MEIQLYINYLLFFVAGIMVVSAVYNYEQENYLQATQYIALDLLNCFVALFVPFS